MTTLGIIKTQVSERLLDPSNVAVSSSSVVSSINDAVRYWKYRRFWFNEVEDTATMTAEDGTIPLPSDFLVPSRKDGAFQIEYSEARYRLSKISENKYDGAWLGNGYGLPRFYAYKSGSYEAYPLPDRAYTIRRHYLKDYSDLVDDSDANDFTTNAARLLVLWSLANLSGELRQDEKMESYYRNAARDEYNELQLMNEKTTASGKIEIDSCLV